MQINFIIYHAIQCMISNEISTIAMHPTTCNEIFSDFFGGQFVDSDGVEIVQNHVVECRGDTCSL